MRVLVADDDLGSRLVAQAAVQALGHECVVASDGQQAWQLYQQWRPEVLVTDRAMPGMDGTQLCRRIRDAESGSYTYIILLSGAEEQADVLSGMEAGADDYLVKPLDTFSLQTGLLAARRVTRLHEELSRARAELLKQAHTDPLTELRNRLGLAEDLEALHSSSQRYGRGYCLALCDVDLFKKYNDSCGHQAGDEALRTVAATLAGHAREADRVYRYGGEEFLFLLPEQEHDGAHRALDRIRRAVEDQRIAHRDGGLGGVLTVSIGFSAFTPGRAVTSWELLAEADHALYAAKAAGRNQVVAAARAALPSLQD
jgi:diguanylate cyclase (GGDEF)-like protein